jgi:hypothetical protein
MAITRSQIARQLLQQGGVSMDERSTEDLIDARMAMSYDENRARNEFQRGMNQMYRQKMDQLPGIGTLKLSDIDQTGFSRPVTQEDVDTYNFIPPGFDASDPLTGMRQTDMLPGPVGMRSLAEMDAIRKRVLAAQEAQQRADSGLVDSVTGKRYMSQQEAIDDLGIVTYNQRFAEGGEVSLDDAKENAPPGEFLAYINPKEADMLRNAGGSGIVTPMGIPSFFDPGSGPGSVSESLSEAAGLSGPSGDGGGNGDSDPTTGSTFPNLNKVTPKDVFKTSADNPNLHRSAFDRMMIQMIPGIGGAINLGEMNAFNLPQFRYSNTGGIDDRFNTTDDDNNQIVKPMMPMVPKLPSDIEPEKSDYDDFVQRFTLPERFRLAEGGEPRQAYGLGKLVKKVTGAVKKVAKSDIGKAALAGAAIYGLGGGGNPFTAAGRSGFSFGNLPFVGGLFTAPGNPGQQLAMGSPFSRFLRTTAIGKATLGIGAATAATAFLTPKQEEEVDSLSKRISDNTGIDVEAIRKEVQKATAEGQDSLDALKAKYPFLLTADAAKADGGRIEKAIGGVINEEDEMLNMGGNEMDLRGGGFVPLGEYEKKDDVPARLSKNEFVFTADAVRAAGGGSVDRGADLMYKTMKQLENKVV